MAASDYVHDPTNYHLRLCGRPQMESGPHWTDSTLLPILDHSEGAFVDAA